MKYTTVSAVAAMIVACACGPASAKSMTCLGVDMAVMTTMIGKMADVMMDITSAHNVRATVLSGDR